MKEYQKAAQSFRQAIFYDPDYADAYYNLAGLLASQDSKQEADRLLVKSLELFRQQGRGKEADYFEMLFRDYFNKK